MSDLPLPLTPADCDMRGSRHMKLDVVGVRNSDAASGDRSALGIALLLWCASWHQIPAASLPNDDRALARLAGYGRDVRHWKGIRERGALHGFVLCSDGRLYHPDIAEAALEVHRSKQRIIGNWPLIRSAVLERDKYTCQYCGAADGPLDCDHVFPLSRGGDSTMDNLTAACVSCNRSKGARTPVEWRGVQ